MRKIITFHRGPDRLRPRTDRVGYPIPEVWASAARRSTLAQEVRGLDPSELRRLKQLEEENRKLKQLVADLSLG